MICDESFMMIRIMGVVLLCVMMMIKWGRKVCGACNENNYWCCCRFGLMCGEEYVTKRVCDDAVCTVGRRAEKMKFLYVLGNERTL